MESRVPRAMVREMNTVCDSRTYCALRAQIYYIWYGNWGNLANNGTATRPTTVKVLTDMAQSMGGKPWYNIVTTYYDNGGKVPNKATYGGRATVGSSSPCYMVRGLPEAHPESLGSG